MALNKQVFTNAGLDMLGQADAGAQLVIQRIVVGSGSATQDSDLYPLTQLISWKADITITRQVDLGGGQMQVSGTLNEWEMPAGAAFQFRELGIMAYTVSGGGTIGGGGGGTVGSSLAASPKRNIRKLRLQMQKQATPKDTVGTALVPAPKTPTPAPLVADTLYTASNVYSDPPNTITPGGTTSWNVDVIIEIDRATDVTIIIGSVGTYDAENIPTDPAVGPGWYAGRDGNVFQFKRAVQGAGITLTDSTDRITIAVAQLTVNTDIYVPTSYPGLPAGAIKFDSIQQAHDYLLAFRIPASVQANIHVYSGVFDVHSERGGVGLVFDHPDAKQINLIGQPRVNRAITGVNFVDSGHKDALCSNTGLPAIGRAVYLYDNGTITMPPGWYGGARITSLPAGAARLSILNRSGRTAYGTNYAGQGNLSWFPTFIVRSDVETSGQNVLTAPYGLRSIQNICFDGGFYTLALVGGCALTEVMCIGSARGISLGSGDFSLNGQCIMSDCDFGITGVGTLQAYAQTVINGCTQGINPSDAAMGAIATGLPLAVVTLSHNAYGVFCTQGGKFFAGHVLYLINGTGMRAELVSSINITAVQNPSDPFSNTTDLVAQGGSYIGYNQGSGLTPTCSPAHDTVGNQNAFIHLF